MLENCIHANNNGVIMKNAILFVTIGIVLCAGSTGCRQSQNQGMGGDIESFDKKTAAPNSSTRELAMVLEAGAYNPQGIEEIRSKVILWKASFIKSNKNYEVKTHKCNSTDTYRILAVIPKTEPLAYSDYQNASKEIITLIPDSLKKDRNVLPYLISMELWCKNEQEEVK